VRSHVLAAGPQCWIVGCFAGLIAPACGLCWQNRGPAVLTRSAAIADDPGGTRMASASMFERIRSKAEWCRHDVFDSTLALAGEIARDGREGRRIGTLFTLGRADAVLACSRALILDPLAGHAPGATHITDPRLRGTIKELAQLDGAFVIAEDGTVVAACRYLDATAEGLEIPLGLGSRHVAAAAISKQLGIVAIVLSETAVIRVFHDGELVSESR